MRMYRMLGINQSSELGGSSNGYRSDAFTMGFYKGSFAIHERKNPGNHPAKNKHFSCT